MCIRDSSYTNSEIGLRTVIEPSDEIERYLPASARKSLRPLTVKTQLDSSYEEDETVFAAADLTIWHGTDLLQATALLKIDNRVELTNIRLLAANLPHYVTFDPPLHQLNPLLKPVEAGWPLQLPLTLQREVSEGELTDQSFKVIRKAGNTFNLSLIHI